MKFGPPQDVRESPSLLDEPCRYPDARTPRSRTAFAYAGEQVWELQGPLDSAALDAWLIERSGAGFSERTALLAVGSNAYPRQLFDKFTGRAGVDQGIVTLPVRLRDLGVAFCPILSRNGYVPVTLAAREGHIEPTWIQWLTAAQLARVRATEGPRYELAGGERLAASAQLPGAAPQPAELFAWWFDSVLLEGAQTHWWDAADERAQERLMARLAGPHGWDGCRVNESRRAAIGQRLRAAAALNPMPAGWRVLT